MPRFEQYDDAELVDGAELILLGQKQGSAPDPNRYETVKITIDQLMAAGTGVPDNSVTTAKIAADAVATAKIADAAVTLPKVASTVLDRSNHAGVQGSGTLDDIPTATGDGVTDDRAALVTATGTATRRLWLPSANTFKISKYIPMATAQSSLVAGAGSTIRYPSGDVTVVDDATTNSHAEARSAFLLMGGSRNTFSDLLFHGDNTETSVQINTGSAVYSRGSTDVRIVNSTALYGASLMQQDINTTDIGARIIGNTTYGWRNNLTVGIDAVIALNRWEQPVTAEYDRIGYDGSSHAIYMFAGRRNTAVIGNIFRNVRTAGVKFSGTSQPVRNGLVTGNIFHACGNAVTFGDDTASMPFHTNAMISSLLLHNVAVGRVGWNDNAGIYALGAKGLSIHDVGMYWDRDNLATAGAVYGVDVHRYDTTAGASSSPVEGVSISDLNLYTQIGSQTGNATRTVTGTLNSGSALLTLTSGSLADSDLGLGISGTGIPASTKIYEILTSSTATMSANATATNTGVTVTVTTGATGPGNVMNAAIKVANVGEGAQRGSSGVRIGENVIQSTGTYGILVQRCTAPVIENNIITDPVIAMSVSGCRMPIIRNNTLNAGASTSANAQLRLTACSFPIVHGNVASGRIVSGAAGQSWGISDSSGGSTAIQHPLLGARGMVRTSDGRGDLVMAYGSAWTDGDTVALNTTTFTYQGTSPGALQFNSQASLITLINAAGSGAWIAADYGADYSPSVATGHIRIRRAVAGSAAWYVQVTTALPTAGMVLANGTGGNPLRCNSLGAEASGTGTQLVIWSPLATDNACLTLEPANASAAALIAANGYYVTNRGGADSGSAFVVQVGATAGTEIFRWAIT